VARRFGGSIRSRVVGSTHGLNPVEEEGPEAWERFGGICGAEVSAMLVFLLFKQAGEIIEVRVFPGFYSRLVIAAMIMAKLVAVAVGVTVRVIVRGTMRVLFSWRMLVWFSPVPVDVHRAAHGERKSPPERALFQVQGIMALGELACAVEAAALEPPCCQPGDQETCLKITDI
tara:strand:+ start:158 stop:676 length:519 start_codon:yes stop_codon:yes gene_type:complete